MALEKEFEFYKANQKSLLKEHVGKYLVIHGEKVEGAFDTQIEAYTEGQKKFKLGAFLIQQCTPNEEGYTQTYHSRVSFG